MTELLVVGGGKMGEALIGGLLADGWAAPEAVTVVELDPARREALAAQFVGITVAATPTAARGAIVAVKPQHVVSACADLGAAGVPRVLSIAAGVGLERIEAALPAGTAVVRAMPNTASLVGMGASAIAGGTAATEDDLGWAESLLSAVGLVVRVDEPQLEAVTGLSGSGPAYLFLVIEAMTDAGVLAGLTRDVSSALAIQTIRGAGELLATGTPAAELRAAVTSPGGTTAAGLHALESASVRAAFVDAVVASAQRSRELG